MWQAMVLTSRRVRWSGLDRKWSSPQPGPRAGLAEPADVHQDQRGVAGRQRWDTRGPIRRGGRGGSSRRRSRMWPRGRRRAARPCGDRMSMATDRLLRPIAGHHRLRPTSRDTPHRRIGSPPTPAASTLTTSAPRSPSSWPANGPAMKQNRARGRARPRAGRARPARCPGAPNPRRKCMCALPVSVSEQHRSASVRSLSVAGLSLEVGDRRQGHEAARPGRRPRGRGRRARRPGAG